MLFLILFLLGNLDAVTGWQCPTGKVIPGIYVNSGQPAIIGFQTTLQTFDKQLQYNVAAFNESNLYAATFYSNQLRSETSYLESEFIGDANTGNFTVKTNGVHTQDGGVYMLQYKRGAADSYTEMCSMLFVIGKPQKAAISHDNNNILGRNSQLICSILSTTYPTNHTLRLTFDWKVNDVANPSSTRYKYGVLRKTLTIMSVTKEDANKRFKCMATESGDEVTGLTSNYSDDFIFTVIYGPDPSTTELAPPNTKYTINEGVSLNDITCIGDCYPRCNFKWTKPATNGALIVSNNAVLSLRKLSRTEAATYTCEVTNANATVQTERKQLVVHVNYGPDAGSVKLNPVKRTYTENEGTRLNDITCSTACHPTCSYKWTKSGTNAVVSNNAVLTLGTLNRDMAATYTCTAANPRKNGTAATDVIIQVRYGPDACMIRPASPLTLIEGESSPIVSCESECYPSCSNTWSNIASNSPIGGNGKFQLENATRHQAGNYQCFCQNTATVHYVKNKTAIMKIIIQYPPDVTVFLSTENITEGNTLIISCDAKGVPSVYNYNGLTQTWSGTHVPNTHTEVSGTQRHSSLHIPFLQLQDSGIYSCYVNNGMKTADTVSSATVKVKVLPKILTHLLKFGGETAGTVNVSVQFYSFPDIEEVVFKQHDNQTMNNGTDKKYIVSHYETIVHVKFYGKDISLRGMQANLIITNLKQDDFGSYKLILKNELGSTISPFTIDAISKPSAPTSFRYILWEGTHSFSWIGGFNGGRLQTFIIQTSIADQDNWQNRTTVTEEMDSQNVVTYWANISSLSPGTYSARLFAWNVVGKSDYVRLNSTFTIDEIAKDNTSLNIAAVIGGLSSSAVLIITVALVAVFIYRGKHWKKGGCSSSSKEGNNTEVQENSYYNLASSPTYEHLQTNEELSGWYASLETSAGQYCFNIFVLFPIQIRYRRLCK
ncbi:hemicentin-2-like isoform X2 [Mercenaria mercenaria]|uniref:hemicentin-2-like isoform X2 n=1 Tax=Mercenaria mercenaria TaxID=6596 RepID=UPI00234EA33C|nr:hemicentin-2-like isoform X2 [Mercenaria mercenaria]